LHMRDVDFDHSSLVELLTDIGLATHRRNLPLGDTGHARPVGHFDERIAMASRNSRPLDLPDAHRGAARRASTRVHARCLQLELVLFVVDPIVAIRAKLLIILLFCRLRL